MPQLNIPSGARSEHLYSALGLALLAFNSRMGIPKDVWESVKSAVVVCQDCLFARTIHGHSAHLTQAGLCSQESRHGGFIIIGDGKGKARCEDGQYRNVPIYISD